MSLSVIQLFTHHTAMKLINLQGSALDLAGHLNHLGAENKILILLAFTALRRKYNSLTPASGLEEIRSYYSEIHLKT